MDWIFLFNFKFRRFSKGLNKSLENKRTKQFSRLELYADYYNKRITE